MSEFKNLLDDVVEETGTSFQAGTDAVALYASQRTAHLSTLVGQPGFMQAVRAERDNVAMYASLSVGDQANAMDNRLLGLIQGALAMGASSATVVEEGENPGEDEE